MIEALKRRRASLAVIVLVVAVLSGIYLYGKGSQTRFQTAKVERGALRATISTTGTLNAVTSVQVGTQVSGQISELLADFNSQVKKGQLIARIDPPVFQARVSQARADVEAAQAQVQNQRSQVERAIADAEHARATLAAARAQTAKARVALLDARRDLDRKLGLFKKDLISRSEYDSAQAAHESAAAQVEASEAQERALASAIRSALAQIESSRAQHLAAEANVRQKTAALQQATIDLGNTFIRSPVNGIVVSRNVDVGQTVAASLSAPTLFTIAQDLTRIQVDTNVDEADVGRMEIGQRAEFTVDSFRGVTFTGEVSQIRMAPKVVQNVVTYNVVIAVDNPNRRLLPGLTASARIVVTSRPDVLKVPAAALRFRPDGDGASGAEASGNSAPSISATSVAGLEQLRQRLARELMLTDNQQQALEPILAQQRERLLGLDNVPGPQRRAAILRIREEAQAKIRAILTPEQVRAYERLPLGQPAGAPSDDRAGTVWALDPRGTPRPISVRVGITDGNFVEVKDGNLKEGQEIVVGVSLPGLTPPSSPPSTTAPRLRF